jgi:hypothetical protein
MSAFSSASTTQAAVTNQKMCSVTIGMLMRTTATLKRRQRERDHKREIKSHGHLHAACKSSESGNMFAYR